jgi:hypothetical protein
MLGLVLLSIGAVLAATIWRIAVGWPGWTPARVTMAMGAVAIPVVLGAWFLAGPMQPGWAARAGTPPRLLVRAAPAAPAPAAEPAVQAPPPIVLPSSATASGVTRLHEPAGGAARVDIALSTAGSTPLQIQVVLNGRAIGEGISMTDGSVVLTPPSGAAPYRGAVTGLSGGNISSTLSDGHGDQIELDLALEISASGQTAGQLAIQTIARGSGRV